MGNRIAPDGGTRFSYALLAFALVVSLVQVVAMTPAQALTGNTGPAPVPGASTAGLEDEDGQWDTKNQHRSWFVDGRWDAILPMASTANGGVASVESAWWIVGEAIPEAPGNQPVPKVQVSVTATDRPDIFWDDANSELYVLMSGGATTSLYVYSYSAGTYTLLRSSSVPDFEAANSRAAIFKDSNGDLWASKMDGGGLKVSRSVDDGASWANPVNLIFPVGEGQTQITQVGNTLAVAAAEDGDNGNENGRFSKYLFYTLDLANVANWNAVTFGTGTLTIDAGAVVAPNETVTIGSKIYRFVTTLTGAVANDVVIGSNPRANLAAAISGNGTPGVQYQADTLPNPDVFADVPVGTDIPLFANVSGTEGNVATTETMAFGQFATPTLTGGASTWARETVPLVQGSNPATVAVVHADDELSLIKDASDNIYIATETQRTGANTQHTVDPQVILYTRTAAGTWTQHNVKMDQQSSVGDYKRPVVAILGSELFIMAIDNSRTGSWYWKRPLTSLPLTSWGGVTGRVFKTDNEFFRNNIVPRDPTTTASRLPILIDWANEDPTQDNTIWQNSFPDTGNQAPQAFAGADKVVSISPATSLGGIVTDGGDNGHDSVTADEPITALWTVVSHPVGANTKFRSSASPTSTVNAALPGAFLHVNMVGVYVLRLTATENGTDPLTNFDEVRVTVQKVNSPPTLSVSEPDNGDTVAVGQPFTFSATASDPEAGNISASITWTSNKNGLLGTGGNLVKSNLSQGTHTITVRVSDGQNAVTVVRTLIVGSASGGGGGGGGGGTPDNPFVDDNGHIFENAIEWLKAEGITLGCNPPTNDRFCPDDPVTRGEMAVFLVRALDYSDNGGGDLFVDDDGLFYENSADRLFTAEVTVGCNPPTNNRYCGERSVTRGQMAAFLARAFSLPAYNGPDRFVDDNGDIFEGAIERLAQAGITVGCNPPTNNRFCPDQAVTRGQMAAFLKRAFGE
ncbi:MAG: S-layer homology domain-containing protein [Acidimicrobiia bacterium]